MIECAEGVAFTLYCLIPSVNVPGTFEKATFAIDEDELKTILKDFGLDEIPRIVSVAKHYRKIQVNPNRDSDHPQQVLSLLKKTPVDPIDWGDDVDNQPVHELPRPGHKF